jgi:hypothetical protein
MGLYKLTWYRNGVAVWLVRAPDRWTAYGTARPTVSSLTRPQPRLDIADVRTVVGRGC